MTRRELLTYCVAGCLAADLVVKSGPAGAQQPQAPGRARLQTAPPTQANPPQQGQAPQGGAAQPQNGTPPKQQRPQTELQIPKELEDLLVIWEQQSSKVTKLRGEIYRYKYDSVYSVETRAKGVFWYQSPDMGRIDFGPGDLSKTSDKKGINDILYVVQGDGNQRWICTGKQVFIIDDDKHIFDKIDIPAQQQGKNIMNGPLPFLFGMKAAQAKQRYHLSLGSMHFPQGRQEKLANGTTRRWPPQIHIVAVPKLQVDAREWSRAEVQLDAKTFIPKAIKLFNPQQTMETVYTLPPSGMKANEAVWLNNPFNDRPPTSYTLGFDERATNEELQPAKTK